MAMKVFSKTYEIPIDIFTRNSRDFSWNHQIQIRFWRTQSWVNRKTRGRSSTVDEFQFRWLKIKAIIPTFSISITLFSNHLKLNSS